MQIIFILLILTSLIAVAFFTLFLNQKDINTDLKEEIEDKKKEYYSLNNKFSDLSREMNVYQKKNKKYFDQFDKLIKEMLRVSPINPVIHAGLFIARIKINELKFTHNEKTKLFLSDFNDMLNSSDKEKLTNWQDIIILEKLDKEDGSFSKINSIDNVSDIVVSRFVQLLFNFDDILRLNNLDVQTLIKEIDAKDLVVALKDSKNEILELILDNMSQRMGECVKCDIEYLHNVKPSHVKEAKKRIYDTMLRLYMYDEISFS